MGINTDNDRLEGVQGIDMVPGDPAVAPAGVARFQITDAGVLQVSFDGGAFEDVGAGVSTIVAGTGIAVDDTDPTAPVVSVLSSSGWATEQAAALVAAFPGLDGFGYIRAAQVPQGGAVPSTNDGAVEGGGRTGTNATATFITGSIYQAPLTGTWAFSVRARILLAAGGQTNAFGISNAGGTADCFFGMVGATTDENFIVACDGTTSTLEDTGVANDEEFHTFMLGGDGDDVRFYIDGVLAHTEPITNNLADAPHYMFFLNTATTEVVWAEALYGYVTP